VSSWLADKLAAESPAPPPAVASRAVAPGAWWQEDIHVQRPSDAPQIQSQPLRDVPGTVYHPQAAQVLSAEDTCPACGSANYCEYLPDYSQGGQNMGKIRKCFDCRYPATAVPAPDAGGTAKTAKAARQYASAGSWGGEATFASAPRIM
jgi:hypothetical protein